MIYIFEATDMFGLRNYDSPTALNTNDAVKFDSMKNNTNTLCRTQVPIMSSRFPLHYILCETAISKHIP